MTRLKIQNSNVVISIILCCYNSEKYLEETLQSIVDQTFKNWELIIVNDGSQDNTLKILSEFVNSNKHLRITLINQTNQGLADSRNNAIEIANSNWIAIIDHDDLWLPEKLEIQYDLINKNKNCFLFFSDFYLFNNKSIKSRFEVSKEKDGFIPYKLNLNKINGYRNLIKYGCFIGSSTVIFNKEVLKFVGNFDGSYKFITDYVFFIKISEKFDILASPEPLSKWRSHNDQTTLKMNNSYFFEMFNFYLKLYFKNNISFNIKMRIILKHLRLIVSFLINKNDENRI